MKYSNSCSERIFIFAFLTCHIVFSYLFVDLYPFSSMPMFSANPSILLKFEVIAPDGTQLPTSWFGMDARDLANPQPRIGMTLPPSLCDDLTPFLQDNEEAKMNLINNAVQIGMSNVDVEHSLKRIIHDGPRELTVSLRKLFVDRNDGQVKNQVIQSWKVAM